LEYFESRGILIKRVYTRHCNIKFIEKEKKKESTNGEEEGEEGEEEEGEEEEGDDTRAMIILTGGGIKKAPWQVKTLRRPTSLATSLYKIKDTTSTRTVKRISSIRIGNSNFISTELVPILVPLLRQDSNLKVSSIIKQYTYNIPTGTYCSSVKKKALELIAKSTHSDAFDLEMLRGALKEKNWILELTYKKGDHFNQIVIDYAKEQAKYLKDGEKEWDLENLIKVAPNTKNFYSWFLTTNNMDEKIKKGRGLFGSDFAHMKYGGIMWSFEMLDGNNQCFPVALGCIRDNEKESTWDMGHEFLNKNVPSLLSNPNFTCFSDSDKGGLKSIRKYSIRHFDDYHHNIRKLNLKGEKYAKEYEKAFNSTNLVDLRKAISKYSPKTIDYFKYKKEDEIYPLLSPNDLHGRKGSSFVESDNRAALVPIRNMPFNSTINGCVQWWKRRLKVRYNIYRERNGCGYIFAKKIQENIDKMQQLISYLQV